MRNVTIFIIILGVAISTPVFGSTNLPVPFTAQAPHGNWSQPWQDACEESVIVMVDYFYKGHSGRSINSNEAASSIRKAYNVKTDAYGWSLDEEADKMVDLINNYYGWEAKVVESPSIDDIKNEIDNGRPVILPTHGRHLYNPYFQDGGPDYHTVVISGYDDEKKEFITQEPGTRRGLDFRYSYDRLMNAMHDFVHGRNSITGRKVAIFTSPEILVSRDYDGDKDGLPKIKEISSGTVLWLLDSDGDGFTDGEEVRAGYLPTVAESRLPDGTLVKAPFQPEVYIVKDGKKEHIQNEQEFLGRGFQWSDILTVSSKFINFLRSI